MDGVTVIASAGASHQVKHQQALAKGLQAHGIPVQLSHTHHRIQTHRVACWGWRQGKSLRAAGHDVLVMERGYIGDRFAWTSLAWNGLNNRGHVQDVPDDGGERFDQHHAGLLQPWNPGGEYVLIIGQVPGDMSLQGRDMTGWYAEQARKDWRMPVRFRPHPLAYRRGPMRPVPGAPTINGELSAALHGAAWVVTYNSNTGVDALLAGKPTHVDDAGSMAWNVTNREQWAHRLVWRQWTIDEIASGFALQHAGVTS